MIRVCPICDTSTSDDSAVFCENCGTKLPPVIENPPSPPSPPEEPMWKCKECGHMNSMEYLFCTNCRQKRDEGKKPSDRKPVTHGTSGKEESFPEGLYSATAQDLQRKKD